MLAKLIVFVEEPSMEAALQELLPKLLGDVEFQIIRFQCKDELLLRLPQRLAGYAAWLPQSVALLVLVDRDDDDCSVLKQQLENMAAAARLVSKTAAGPGQRFQIVNRIAIEELEAWFFGDWTAVQAAFPRVPATVPQKASFRDPDTIAGGTWEALERVMQQAGYFKPRLRKIECARAVAEHMEPARNRSASFQAFVSAIEAVRAQA
jgi:hypothetical protein